MKGANVKVFDQVTTVSFPGSSGGGMYLKDSGVYIGMLTQGVMQLQGFNFIVPVRRIHAWAKASKVEWAIDPTVPLPSLKEIDAMPVEDAGQSPGGYPQRNPAGGRRTRVACPPSSRRSTSTTPSTGSSDCSTARGVGPLEAVLPSALILPLVTDST